MPSPNDAAITKEQLEAILDGQKRLIKLDRALTEILQTCMNVPRAGRRPFFFIVGAGVSYPPVPLASEIVKECQKEASKYYPEPSDLGATEMEKQMSAYSRWVSRAFPQRGLRQLYFQQKIEGQYISDPNLCLAHLLLDNTITNLVVTTNFDDFLSRALTLFNKRHIICDHPRTAQRIDPERVDLLQLIHVHGTYWFYDSSNLREEIEQSASSASQMQPLLANILWNRSPLVIGYGGWENDVIMTSLSRRLESELPYNLYWFCYRYADALSLPSFLYNNPQVYFVVPEKPDDAAAARTPRDDAKITPAKAKHDAYSQPADRVLVEMATKFGLQPPSLTKTPLPFFAEHLRRSLPRRDPRDPESEVLDNVFLFKEVIKRIKQAEVAHHVVEELARRYQLDLPDDADNPPEVFIQRLGEKLRDGLAQARGAAPPDDEAAPTPAAQPEAPPASGEGAKVDGVLDALRSHRYADAINLGKTITPSELSPNLARDLMAALWQAALGIYDNSETELEAYDAIARVGTPLLSTDPPNAAATRFLIARALYNKGVAHQWLDQVEEAADAYRLAIDKVQIETPDADTRDVLAGCFNNLGYLTMLKAKRHRLEGAEDLASSALHEAQELLRKGDALSPEEPLYVGNLGYVAFLLGETERARELLTQAISLGGEEIREVELEDSAIHELPQDAAFRQLVESIPAAPAAGPAPA